MPAGARQVFADHVLLPSTGDLFVRIERPIGREPRRWIFLVHGLLDSHRAYDVLAARLLAAGYGVRATRPRRFARSLRPHHHKAVSLDYRENVRDLDELLALVDRRFGVVRPRVVGHSMGGGLALALLATPGWSIGAERNVVVSPYVYRNENYVAKKMHLSALANLEPWVPDLLKISRRSWPIRSSTRTCATPSALI